MHKTRTNPLVVSLLEDFTRRRPEKDRPPEEKKLLREIWKPGDRVLPEPLPEVLDEAADMMEAPRRRPPVAPGDAAGHAEQRARAPSLQLTTSYSGAHSLPSSPLSIAPQRRSASPLHAALSQVFPRPRTAWSVSNPNTPPTLHTPPPPSHSPRDPAPRIHRAPSTHPPTPPATVLQMLSRSTPTTQIHITCDTCSVRLDTSVHHECLVCTLFHQCLRCAKTHPHTHPTTKQTLTPSWPRRHLNTGIFCVLCSTWCDEDRSTPTPRPNSLFWHCNICNAGEGWEFCSLCVQKGWVCTHTLTLYTNTRTRTSDSGLLRGARTPAVHPDLSSLGYTPVRWEEALPACAVCALDIPAHATWVHCIPCALAVCTTCFYNTHRAFPSASRALHRFLPCTSPHPPAGVLAASGKAITHCAVGAQGAPRPRMPEWIADDGPRARGLALAANWPDEMGGEGMVVGERGWGRLGQWLSFPQAAEVSDVVVAFVEGQREWCWGSYCGVGGLFLRECVELEVEGGSVREGSVNGSLSGGSGREARSLRDVPSIGSIREGEEGEEED